MVRFKNDAHWNEAGNLAAAIHLYRLLERENNLSRLLNSQLKKHCYAYYSAFDSWMPPDDWVEETAMSKDSLEQIRDKFIELERSW